MAKPIKETPVLKGKDAKTFIKNMNLSSSKKVDEDKIAKMQLNFSRLNSIAKF